ncbi:uncharacterized protein LOC4578401 [Anopheles gambiae]|uniref:uncharacterized protein LOC4578401 n=1 Tax=Anopheles gambiae TaxID=7165 RepID=UPI002AC9E248|nr:uncharacterized protein LOC4578401 [Anopheles gambiae]
MEAPYTFQERDAAVKSPYEPAKTACDDEPPATVLKSSNSAINGSGETVKSTGNRPITAYYHPSEKQQTAASFKTEDDIGSGGGGGAGVVDPPCWALIEWDTANEEPNAYTVIESSQIVDIPSHEGRSDENHNGPQRKRDAGLYTGKMVHVRRGRYIMPATIVMISEDRKFLETELQELRVMVANCLMTKSVNQTHSSRKHHLPPLMYYGGPEHNDRLTPSHQKPGLRVYGGDEHWISNSNGKRQRRDSVSSVTNSKDNGGAGKRLSTAATTTTTQEPSGAAAGNEEASISFSSDCSHQTESSPPPPPPMRTKMARYTHADRRAPSRHEAPPMTFDQQTQTTGAASDAYGSQQQDAHFARVLSYLESIMAEQKSCRMESDYNRKVMQELHEKLVDQHALLADMRKELTELHKKQQPSGKQGRSGDVMVANVVPESNGTVFSYETTSTNNNHIVVSSLKENGSQQWLKLQSVKRIADVDRQQPDHTTSNSNQSWASSSVAATSNNTTSTAAADDSIAKSCSESTANNTTTTMFVEFEDEIVSTIGNSSPNSSSAVAVQELIRDDWNDSLQDSEAEQGGGGKGKRTRTSSTAVRRSVNKPAKVILDLDPTSEKVPLGSNNTLVPKRALEAVRWHSYKFGTRKLLQMLFTRETLASCSLSGRPCPARINEVDRPVKGALPPKVVADIVEYVMKKCNVEECHVRGVITNKCADENKMLRQRMGGQEKARTNKQADDQADWYDKENVSAEH